MSACGATLREVGTTNKTRAADYAAAIGEHTRADEGPHQQLPHRRLYREREPRGACRARSFPRSAVFRGLGSGSLFAKRSASTASRRCRSVRAGADAVCSGDKLLGRPAGGYPRGGKSPALTCSSATHSSALCAWINDARGAGGDAPRLCRRLRCFNVADPRHARGIARGCARRRGRSAKLTERGISAEVLAEGMRSAAAACRRRRCRVRRGGHAAALPHGRADGAPAAARNACCRAHCARTAAALPAHPPAGGIRRARARRRESDR